MAPMPSCLTNAADIAHIANQALSAWHNGFELKCEWQAGTDSWESEKLEVLEGALECLKAERHAAGAFRSARLRAALGLLEHLAQSGAEPLRASTRRSETRGVPLYLQFAQ